MSDRPPTSLERMRESVAIRVQATSLRAVARQVGMSPTGLEKFLRGGTPYARSRQKLHDWWMREGSTPRAEVTSEGVSVALGALVRDLAPPFRDEAVRDLLRTLLAAYASRGPVPAWLDELCAEWLADPGWEDLAPPEDDIVFD